MNWLEAMKAFADGKSIQVCETNGTWQPSFDKNTPYSGVSFYSNYKYRIAPKVYKFRFAEIKPFLFPQVVKEEFFSVEKDECFVRWLTPVIEIEMK